MKELYLVGFDDTESSRRAVDFATARAKASNGKILLLYVLEWSPYSFLTNEELAERHARRQEELDRAEKVLEPVAENVRSAGVECDVQVRHGHTAELICERATEHEAVQIVVGRTGDSPVKARLLGGLVVTLAQVAPVPLTVVP